MKRYLRRAGAASLFMFCLLMVSACVSELNGQTNVFAALGIAQTWTALQTFNAGIAGTTATFDTINLDDTTLVTDGYTVSSTGFLTKLFHNSASILQLGRTGNCNGNFYQLKDDGSNLLTLQYTTDASLPFCSDDATSTIMTVSNGQAPNFPSGISLNGDTTLTASPRMTFGGYLHDSTGGAANAIAAIPSVEKPITVTQIGWAAGTPGVTCVTPPVVSAERSSDSSRLSSTIGNGGSGGSTSGTLTVGTGEELFIKLTTAPSGCATAPAKLNFTVVYKMQ